MAVQGSLRRAPWTVGAKPVARDNNNDERFDIRAFIAKHGGGTVSQYPDRQFVYRQGDPAAALYYIVSGTVKVTFNSEDGKEAVIAILGAGDFLWRGMPEWAIVTAHDDRDRERLRDCTVRSGDDRARA